LDNSTPFYRYFIRLAYKGTNFHGWQRQENAHSVQKEIENALTVLLRENIELTGCGRTDSGVHASEYFAHFNYSKPIENTEQLTYRMNSFLTKDISIFEIFRVRNDFHSRFSALSRTYEYRIDTGRNPFLQEFSYYFYAPLDLTKMNEACAVLFEYNDFTSFAKLHSNNKTNLCRILRADWQRNDQMIVFTISADRFLRNMVRSISGTMLDLGIGRISLSDFRQIIEAKSRSKAGFSVPASGLFLTHIEYPSEFREYEQEQGQS
jgi:tRNA pseudouridine38-40 synthase